MIEIQNNNLSKLDLSNRGLNEFPLEILKLKNLKKLNLSGNKIQTIPKEIEMLKNLEILDLSNNSIKIFYSKICSLQKLKTLNLNKNNIKTIPKQIGQLNKLKVLQLANNKIANLPDSFSNLNLEKLNLSKNELVNFPKQILNVKSLKFLWINNLLFENFPQKEINENLINLKGIYCFGSLTNSIHLDKKYLILSKLKGNSIKELRNTIILNNKNEMSKSEKNRPKKLSVVKNKIFISYSHKDSSWLNKVQTNLKVLEHNDHEFQLWDDTRIKGGDKWKIEIEKALNDAGIAILIVSTDFLASDFIRNDELPTLLRNAEENGTRILPLIVRPCLFTKDKYLSVFQSINPPDKPLSSLKEDQAENELVKLAMTVSNLLEE